MKLFKTTLAAAVLVAGFASSANAATDTTQFQVRITITESCNFSTSGATDVDFGSQARGAASNTDAQGALVVNCTSGTPFNIGLDAGTSAGATVTTRKMTNGASSIPYGLYQDSNRTVNWGNTVGSDTLSSAGTGVDQTIGVYGRVTDDANVPAGVYTDTITATITY